MTDKEKESPGNRWAMEFGSKQGTGSSGTSWHVEAMGSTWVQRKSQTQETEPETRAQVDKDPIAVVTAQSGHESAAGQLSPESPSLSAKAGLRHLLRAALGPGNPGK